MEDDVFVSPTDATGLRAERRSVTAMIYGQRIEMTVCPCCGCTSFSYEPVLWERLIAEWGLSPEEIAYVNRQQGCYCSECRSSLRSMTLAKAVLNFVKYSGTLAQYVRRPFRSLAILEVNDAGSLNGWLGKMSRHVAGTYPEVDMMKMPYNDCEFDIVIHSDTLEHVPEPVKALSECRRVLKTAGACIYTVPVIIGRMSRSREGLPKSYHGNSKTDAPDWSVCTEYGADVWADTFRAGFSECRMTSLEFPSSVALTAVR